MTKDLTVLVKKIIEVNDKEWESFLTSSTEANFYCTIDYWTSFEDSFLLFVTDMQNEIIAGVPFRIQSVLPLIGSYFRFCWLDSSALVNRKFDENSAYILKSFVLRSLIDYLNKTQSIIIFISNKIKSNDAALFKELGFVTGKCSSLVIDLKQSEDEIIKLFTSRNRETIRHAQKVGVNVKILEGESALSHVHEYGRIQHKLFEHKKGTYSEIYSKSELFIKKILSAKSNKTYLAIAYYQGLPAAGAIFVSYDNTFSWYLGATDFELVKTSKASNLLQYEAIKYAKNNGFLYYDFGGIPNNPDPSMSTYGVYRFKKSFGGQQFEYDEGYKILRKLRYSLIWQIQKRPDSFVVRVGYRIIQALRFKKN